MHWRRYLDDPALAGFVAREVGRGRVLVRREHEPWIEHLGLLGEAPEPVEVITGGRSPHPLVELPDGERVVVRRYLRGGAVRHLNRSTYFAGHRAFEELRATETARAAGVRAPLGIAAAERRHVLGYSAWLATRWIPDARDLHAWLPTHAPAEQLEALRDLGRQIGKLHAAGVAHPDLNLRNVLVAPAGSNGAAVHLLDFDRARLFRGGVPRARRARDLVRLARSARKLDAAISPEGWEALRSGYGADWPLRAPLG